MRPNHTVRAPRTTTDAEPSREGVAICMHGSVDGTCVALCVLGPWEQSEHMFRGGRLLRKEPVNRESADSSRRYYWRRSWFGALGPVGSQLDGCKKSLAQQKEANIGDATRKRRENNGEEEQSRVRESEEPGQRVCRSHLGEPAFLSACRAGELLARSTGRPSVLEGISGWPSRGWRVFDTTTSSTTTTTTTKSNAYEDPMTVRECCFLDLSFSLSLSPTLYCSRRGRWMLQQSLTQTTEMLRKQRRTTGEPAIKRFFPRPVRADAQERSQPVPF